MSDPPSLVRLVPWAQRLLGEVLGSGDLAVDLTAGTGRDTLFLFRCVGPQGRILAFDIQDKALRQTGDLLIRGGAAVDFWNGSKPGGAVPAGVHLIHDSHASLDAYLTERPKGIIANLGYLPGGNTAMTTQVESTLAALGLALELLAPGGRLVLVLYVGHPGGVQEAQEVDALIRSLPSEGWEAMRLQVANTPGAPFLLAAEKRR